MNLDGTQREYPFLAVFRQQIVTYAFDLHRRKVYWIEGGPYQLMRRSIDRWDVEALNFPVYRSMRLLAVDPRDSRLYYQYCNEDRTQSVKRLNPDDGTEQTLARLDPRDARSSTALLLPRAAEADNNEPTSGGHRLIALALLGTVCAVFIYRRRRRPLRLHASNAYRRSLACGLAIACCLILLAWIVSAVRTTSGRGYIAYLGADRFETFVRAGQLVVTVHAETPPYPSGWGLQCSQFWPLKWHEGLGLQWPSIRHIPTYRSSVNDIRMSCPFWVPFALLSLIAAALFYRQPGQMRPGHCRSCGYDLTGNTSGICPECGAMTAPRPRLP
jgi:hypothetical protein